MLAAAAALVVVVTGLVVINRGDDDGVTFALAGTDAAPGAWATGVVAANPAGLKILLDADGLSGAPDGYMYEAWVGDGTIGVSAGTFHAASQLQVSFHCATGRSSTSSLSRSLN